MIASSSENKISPTLRFFSPSSMQISLHCLLLGVCIFTLLPVAMVPLLEPGWWSHKTWCPGILRCLNIKAEKSCLQWSFTIPQLPWLKRRPDVEFFNQTIAVCYTKPGWKFHSRIRFLSLKALVHLCRNALCTCMLWVVSIYACSLLWWGQHGLIDNCFSIHITLLCTLPFVMYQDCIMWNFTRNFDRWLVAFFYTEYMFSGTCLYWNK